MRAVLMAGGSGTRLRPLTCDLPKPMVPILNRPIAEHIINLLKRHQITEIIATLHYLPDLMRDYFQDGSDFGVRITYAVEEDRPLGTAGCVKNTAELLNSTFLVISGDSITDLNLTEAIAFHKAKGSKATIILTKVSNPLEFGVVITDENHHIRRFLEKPSPGEIFSDTVNTGIYILEPEVLEYLPSDLECDFSKDLFPLLLEKGEPMYGYVAEGYWCDVGNLDTYRESQYDALQKKVNLEFAYAEWQEQVWIGQNTQIDPTVELVPPCLIGNNCRIMGRVKIEGGTVVGDNVTIGLDADLKRPIIFNGVIIGDEVDLSGCVVGRGARVDRRAHVLEGAVVGSLSTVGEESQISPNVRVWPSKNIEAGATLHTNLIWGHTAHRNLFGQRGVQGLANIDITPTFAVKLGEAYGSTLKPTSTVIVSRDQRSISRMVSRSLIAGLMSVGINIQNLEATAIPLSRTVVPKFGVAGGIHVRVHPDRPDYILIEIFDSQGINISKSQEKKIEGAYFKEELRRAQIHEIGEVSYAGSGSVIDIYSKSFQKHLNIEAIRHSGSKVVIDYGYGVSGAILPLLLGKFGCDAVVLNASLNQVGLSNEEKEELLVQLGEVVKALKANFGVQVAANGEQLILVDELGYAVRGEMLTGLMVNIMLTASPRSSVVVPVQASSAIEEIAARHNGKVIRTKSNPTALMEASQTNPNVVLGGSGSMGFIFPQLHPGFDAMFCIAKLIEMLMVQERSLAQIRAELPLVTHKSETVRCPWNIKGSLMRHLIEIHASKNLELIDGVKIYFPSPPSVVFDSQRNTSTTDRKDSGSNGFNGATFQEDSVTPSRLASINPSSRDRDHWVLILPDAGEPMVHIFTNGTDSRWVNSILTDYTAHVREFVAQELH